MNKQDELIIIAYLQKAKKTQIDKYIKTKKTKYILDVDEIQNLLISLGSY